MNPIGQQMYQQQPCFKLFSRGHGISEQEFNAITTSALNAYRMHMNPLSSGTANGIKQMIGGEWFVFVCPLGITNYDFSLSVVTGGDYLSFSIDNFNFQVCRLRD